MDWLRDYELPLIAVPTELGLCRTINFCDEKNYLRDNVEDKRIFQGVVGIDLEDVTKPENETQPYMTSSVNSGFMAVAFKKGEKIRAQSPLSPIQLSIHSPFEWPTKRNSWFTLVDMDYDTFWVTPQLDTIDDTMIAMEPQE